MNSLSGSKHPIQVVSRRTGLSPDLIRAWERRYGAVSPERSGTNRRLYSDEDVERLRLLRLATRGGRRIGDVAGLALDELRSLVAEDQRDAVAPPASGPGPTVESHLAVCMDAIDRMDSEALGTALANANVDLGTLTLVEDLLLPLMRRIGDRWHDGGLRVVQEHVATSVVRSFVGSLQESRRSPELAPELLVTTPAGQVHEIGALVVSVIAALDGWRSTYLGPDVPAEEIAAAVRQRKPRAVALSVVYPSDDPRLGRELTTLRSLVGKELPVLVGGKAAAAYGEALDGIGARRLSDIAGLRAELDRLRYEN